MGVWQKYIESKKRLIDLMIEAKKTEPEGVCFSDYLADVLIANGVIVPPCKIGDTIYRVCSPRGKYHKPWVRQFKLTWKTLKNTIEDFGKTVFLTYEEAERVANGRKTAD